MSARIDEHPPLSVITARLLYWLLGAIETLLAIRVVFTLLGANPANPIANLVFTLSYPFAAPFFTLFGYEPTYGLGRLETSTLVAMAIYAAVGAGVIALLRIPRSGDDV